MGNGFGFIQYLFFFFIIINYYCGARASAAKDIQRPSRMNYMEAGRTRFRFGLPLRLPDSPVFLLDLLDLVVCLLYTIPILSHSGKKQYLSVYISKER